MTRRFFVLIMGVAVLLSLGGSRSNASSVPDVVHTPAMGSTERKAIMDALRGSQDVKFKVNILKVHNGWAWADVTPLDKSGRPTAEGGPNLLHLVDGVWQVMDLSKVADDPDDPLGSENASPGYVRNLRRVYPLVPLDIFPRSSH